MKKLVSILLAVGLAFTAAYAQTDPFMPPNPITMGMGGAYTANADGYNAFFYNPAGFARDGEFTLLSVNVYGVMDKVIYQMLVDVANGKDPLAGLQAQALGKSLGVASRDTAGVLAASGLNPTTIDSLSTSSEALKNYLSTVSASPGGDQAIADALTTMLQDPANVGLQEALAQSQIDVNAISSGADPNILIGALLPALLTDPDLASALVTDFVLTVQAESGVAAPQAALDAGDAIAAAIADLNAALMELFPSGNANMGAMIGIGWVGKGLGIGLFTNINAGLYTPADKSLLSSVGRANMTLTLAGGLGFNIWDGFSVGFSLRPTLIGYASVLPSSLIVGMLNGSEMDIASILSNGIYKGFRLGVDVGALLDIGDFTLGLAVKDLLPLNFVYKRYDTVDALLQDLSNFKDATAISTAYQVPILKINVGAQWHPDLGTFANILDPRIGVDIMDIMGWVRQLDGVEGSAAAKAAMMSDYNILNNINIGAEIKLFKFLSLRGGLGQGLATVGLGANLFVVDINAAVGARYKFDSQTGALLAKSIDDFSEVGFSVEVAILRL